MQILQKVGRPVSLIRSSVGKIIVAFVLIVAVSCFVCRTDIQVYAYDASDNFYPLNGALSINVLNSSNSTIYSKSVSPVNGKYSLANNKLEDIKLFNIWFTDTNSSSFTFPYNPDVYDYYFVGTLTAMCYQESQSTFKPTVIPMYYYSYDSSSEKQYSVSDVNIFNIDSNQYKGFGFVQKVDFSKANNTSISSFRFSQDVDGVGIKPADLVLEAGIMAVDKTTSTSAIVAQVINQLKSMESSLNDSIELGNQLQQEANDMTQGVLDDAGSAFSGDSAMVQDSVDRYQQSESALMDDNIDMLQDYDFENIFTTDSDFGLSGSLTYVGGWLQRIFLMSDYKIVFGFILSMTLASIVSGLRRLWR